MSDADPQSSHTAEDPPSDLPGGMFGRSLFMRLDDEERAAYASLDADSREVWAAWITGDLDAAKQLDALDDGQRTVTMTALGLEPTPRPAQQGKQLNVTPRAGREQDASAGETLMRRQQSRLDQDTHRTPDRFPPVGPRGRIAKRAQPQQHREQQQRRQTARTAARHTRTAVGWILIVAGVAAVVIAQSVGRQSQNLGFGLSVTAQLPWVAPVTWSGIGVAIIGLALLLTGNRSASRG